MTVTWTQAESTIQHIRLAGNPILTEICKIKKCKWNEEGTLNKALQFQQTRHTVHSARLPTLSASAWGSTCVQSGWHHYQPWGCFLTYAAGYGVVPLCQGIGYCQAFDGTGAFQHVASVTFESHHSSYSKVVSCASAMPGLGNRAALSCTGSWDG